MHHIADNLKEIRKQKGWTQSDFAHHLGVKRSLIGAYEEGRADPRISFLQLICDKFNLSLDELINRPLGELGAKKGNDVSGKSLRILPITLDKSNDREVATLVPVKAAAGYLNGFGDVEFIEKLPTFSLPFPELPQDRTYRLFQITGDSMLPIESGSYIICSYVQDWNAIKNDEQYIVISRSEGITFKRVLNNISLGQLRLKSDNPTFSDFDIEIDDVVEVWKAEGVTKIGVSQPDHNANPEISFELSELKERLDRIEKILA